MASYTTRPLDLETWGDFARLVEANNGVWGGCWCMGFHPEGVGKGQTPSEHREAKLEHVRRKTVHQVLVYDGEECVGWCQYSVPAELPSIKNAPALTPRTSVNCRTGGSAASSPARATDAKGSPERPWPALSMRSRMPAGGLVEAYPEQVEGRGPQGGAYLHTGPETLFEHFGFTRGRKIAKWRWVMHLRVHP